MYINNKEIYSENVLVTNDKWFGAINLTLPIDEAQFRHHGIIQIPYQYAPEKDKEFYTGFLRYNNYHVDLDEMTFETRVKNSLKEGGIWAYDVSIDLVGEKNKIVFNLLAPDAVIYARFRAGETFFDKPEEIARLKSFGVDLKNWRELKVVTSGNHIKFLLEEDLIFATDYEGNLGKLTGIQLYFKGSGAADFV